MGGTGPGTQQALHKYLMNERVRQRVFPELLPRTISAIRGGGQTCGEDHLAAWGACLGDCGETQRSRTVPASGQRWAMATNAAGLFPALIMAVLINCTTAASILLSFN